MTREAYVEALVPLASRLSAAVRDDGPGAVVAIMRAVRALAPPDDTDPMTALAVVLAAMINPERTVSDLLQWTIGFGGQPVSVSDVHASMVDLGVAGQLPAAALSDQECGEVVEILVSRGLRQDQIRDHMHAARPDVDRWCNAARKRLGRIAAA